MLETFINSDSLSMRLLRTILEALIGFVIANIAVIAGFISKDPTVVALVTALITCLLSPVLAMLKTGDPAHEETD